MTKWIYTFGDGCSEGDVGMRQLLGGKGANLADMCALSLPVPPGFTITTDVCTHFLTQGRTFPGDLADQLKSGLAAIERLAGKTFGAPDKPLLLSVRSGAGVSMPGMMDTVLNLGLNDQVVESLALQTGDTRFAYDCYRRFISTYSDVVLGLEYHHFEDVLDEYKDRNDYAVDTDLSADDWKTLTHLYQEIVARMLGLPFPQDPHEQLWGAIGSVFGSWMTPRAVKYRELHNLSDRLGTAVTVQAMVFGNRDASSATGVAFTRNPSTGVPELFGEFLSNAQGEDVVSGFRTPQSITEKARIVSGSQSPSMETALPEAYAELTRIRQILEAHYGDMQDVEFTVEQGKLWMLQTRSGKRTIKAALRIAVDLVKEGAISPEDAVMRIDPADLDQLLKPGIDPTAERHIIAKGMPASPGAASGELVFSSEEAEIAKKSGRKVILARPETSPEDIHGMHAAEGILTARGGMTSHAAVVARGMGKPCVSGAGTIRIDPIARTLSVGGNVFRTGDTITIDGSTGHVMKGTVRMRIPELCEDFDTLMGWADSMRVLSVRANAVTPTDAQTARSFGAEGIGLTRTEHMFFNRELITAMREMILADDQNGRKQALAKLLPLHRKSFVDLFTIMAGLPVTIRLLDPPLHEFLPHTAAEIDEVAQTMSVPADKFKRRAHDLYEFNPTLGVRGCRLAIVYPEIAAMQARAIFEAALEAYEKTREHVQLEIMVPLVMGRPEFERVKASIVAVADTVAKETGAPLDYKVGAMIELPRAALQAGELASQADFFSFGTSDLTQATLGLSRYDASAFLKFYMQQGILTADPFSTVDQQGVGELIKIAMERGHAANPNLKTGVCGEHGGDPASVTFFHAVGLDYISCPPYKVPIARLAAAQAAIREKRRVDNARSTVKT